MMAGGGSVVILEDVTESKRAQERITHLAKYDELTGLANRNHFRERINGMLAAMHKGRNHIAIHPAPGHGRTLALNNIACIPASHYSC
jgi:GGDEF domain-containing protein